MKSRFATNRLYQLLPALSGGMLLSLAYAQPLAPLTAVLQNHDQIQPARPVVPLSHHSDRGLNLDLQNTPKRTPRRKPESYAIFTAPARGTHDQPKAQIFDVYTDTGRRRADRQKTILEDDEGAAVIARAGQITGRFEREMHLDQLVEVEKGQTRVIGDHAILRQIDNEMEIIGNVDIFRYGDRFRASSAQFNLDTGEGTLTDARYKLGLTGGQGRAERVDLEDAYNTSIVNATYSTCEGENPDWYLSASTLSLDSSRNVGTASAPVLYFRHVPILAATGLSFPLSSERKSGFLPPTIGATSKGGTELTVPYYFNLAPNYDLTVYPKYYAKRGFQLGAHGRYLGQSYEGQTYVEFLPNDDENGRNRYLLSSQHTHNFAPGWAYSWDFNKASDDRYPDDFSSPFETTGRLMHQHGFLTYQHRYWNLTAGASRYQILQDPLAPIIPSYDRLPYVHVNAFLYDANGVDVNANLQYTRFWLDEYKLDLRRRYQQNWQRGDRTVFKPEISFPVVSGSYFITPKASVHYAKYRLDEDYLDPTRLQERSMSRTIPTLSLDAGLVFEREASFFGSDMTQTLEPRLFYVYTPYKDQDRFPVFDSGEPSFGYAQLFEPNRFVGDDRIADANDLTAAVTSRFLEASGAERMRLTIGQRYHFSEHRVALYSTSQTRSENRSDMLLMVGGLLTPKLAVDASIQYNQSQSKTYASNYSMQWRPADKKIFNAEYRYLRDYVGQTGNVLDQVNVSAQWPLGNRWYAVGQISYSLPDSKAIESVFGVEYNADCWIARFVAQRYVTSYTESNTAILFQLELKGMSKIGANPMNVLRRGIPGYRPLTSYD